MSSFFQYSLESAICLAVLLLPYWVWFRKTTFHQLNRFYLLGVIIFSLSAPLPDIKIKTPVAPAMPRLTENLSFFNEVPHLEGPLAQEKPLSNEEKTTYTQPDEERIPVTEQGNSWNLSKYFLTIYLLGFLIFGRLFLIRLARLFLLFDRGEKYQRDGFTQVHLSGKRVFSFFHLVFFDRLRYEKGELATLLRHEQTHIQQWHSLDVLCMEILQVVFWFDPLYRIYLKFLQQEHEYFVDATASEQAGKIKYAQLLLSLATERPPLVGHSFAYVPVKHRIIKLFQNPSSMIEKSRFFMVLLPMFFTLFLVFSCSFDELEGISIFSSKKVRSVKAYYWEEKSTLGQEIDVAEIQFAEDGTVLNLEINDSSSTYLGKGRANLLVDPEIMAKYGVPQDFIQKNAHWFLTKNGSSSYNYMYLFLYNSYWSLLFELMKSNLYSRDTYIVERPEGLGKLLSLNRTNSSSGSYTKEGYKYYYQDESSGLLEQKMNEQGKVTEWKETSKSIYNVIRTLINSDIKAQKEGEKLYKSGHKMVRTINVDYSMEGRVSKVVSSQDYFGHRQEETTSLKDFSHVTAWFTNDENGRMKRIDIYNKSYKKKGGLIRYLIFHYDKDGHCTKKELFDREDQLKSYSRFVYNLFD